MEDQRKELREALDAANTALTHLTAAREAMRHARNWGIADMLGGGFLATMIKHGKMNQGQRELEAARDALQNFSRELRDVRGSVDFDVNIGDFLEFADFFFDGVLADWMMQSRIAEARANIDRAIDQVTRIRDELKNRFY